MEKKR
jgi:hypothetical protein